MTFTDMLFIYMYIFKMFSFPGKKQYNAQKPQYIYKCH